MRNCENEDYIHVDDHRELFVQLERIIENLNDANDDLKHDLKYYEEIIQDMLVLLSDAQEYVPPDNALYTDIEVFFERKKEVLK